MKKFILMFAAAAMAVSANAQTVTESKTTDNVYVGINGGLSTVTRLSSLALSEGYEYEVLDLYFASDVVVFDNLLDNFLNNLLRLLSQLVAQIVDLSIQSVNL
jgi:ABC-type proline/glycine betaine transport system substrate-binding protein